MHRACGQVWRLPNTGHHWVGRMPSEEVGRCCPLAERHAEVWGADLCEVSWKGVPGDLGTSLPVTTRVLSSRACSLLLGTEQAWALNKSYGDMVRVSFAAG